MRAQNDRPRGWLPRQHVCHFDVDDPLNGAKNPFPCLKARKQGGRMFRSGRYMTEAQVAVDRTLHARRCTQDADGEPWAATGCAPSSDVASAAVLVAAKACACAA